MPPVSELNPLPSSTTSTAKKRPRDDNDAVDLSSTTLPGESDGCVHFDLNCDEIRTRIYAYVESGEMRVSEFQRELGINNTSYHRFMKLRGPKKGIENQTMKAAYPFFKKRELAGIKIPEENVVSLEDREKDKWDVSGIHLDGEEEERVPVYETCADIRRKIKAHLSEAPTTKAEFLREVCKAFPSDPKKTIKQSQMELPGVQWRDAGQCERGLLRRLCLF